MPTFSLTRWIGTVACVLFVSAGDPASARDFDVYGAKDALAARDECPAGQYLFGLAGRTGAWIDQINVICARLNADMTLTRDRPLPMRGGNGGAFEEAVCRDNQVVSEISIGRTANYQITQVRLTCTPLRGGEASYPAFNGTSNMPGGTGATHTCVAGELATGLNIYYGQYVTGVGLICGTFTVPAATCPSGQVWRESFEGDSVCVTPDARFRRADGTCRSGYVWRDTFPGDNVCVTPQNRATAKASAAAAKTVENQMACQDYSDRSLQQIAEADQLKCDFTRVGDFWKPDRQYQVDDCLSHGASAASVAQVNLGTRQSLLDACRQKAGNAGAPEPAQAANATVTADVDLYDAPGGTGNVVGMLAKDDTVPLGVCREDGWCEVTGRGWVWGEYLAR